MQKDSLGFYPFERIFHYSNCFFKYHFLLYGSSCLQGALVKNIYPCISDIPLFLPLWPFPKVSNIPIIQISSSLWFQKCMTLGVWQCPDIPNILLFLPLCTFPKVSNIHHSNQLELVIPEMYDTWCLVVS